MADMFWSDVPLDLIYLLAERVAVDLSDLVRFGAVCRSWRALLHEHQWLGFAQQLEALTGFPSLHLPKLMLAENDSSHDRRCFFDLDTGRIFKLQLPESLGMLCCGWGNGWVLTEGADRKTHLLNPFTRQQIHLPSLQLPLPETRYYIKKAIIVGSPCNSVGGPGATIAVLLKCPTTHRVAFLTLGRARDWTVVTSNFDVLADIAYHRGLLYGIPLDLLMVEVWDMRNTFKINVPTLQLMRGFQLLPPLILDNLWASYAELFYLVEVGGELIGVTKPNPIPVGSFGCMSSVCVFKLENGSRWVQVKDLGDCCLFLGGCTSTALSPVPSTSHFRRNCIYFNFENIPFLGSKDLIFYNLENGKYQFLYKGVKLLADHQYFMPLICATFSPRLLPDR